MSELSSTAVSTRLADSAAKSCYELSFLLIFNCKIKNDSLLYCGSLCLLGVMRMSAMCGKGLVIIIMDSIKNYLQTVPQAPG